MVFALRNAVSSQSHRTLVPFIYYLHSELYYSLVIRLSVYHAASLLSIDFLDFDAGIHTLVITFTDADGIAVQSSFSSSVPCECVCVCG